MKKHVIEGLDCQTVIFQGDCIKGMKSLAAGSVDLIVTSPPYNIGVAYGSYDDTACRSDYLLWSKQWLSEAARVLSDGGSLFLNVGSKPTDPLVPHQILTVALEMFVLQNTIHWIKSIHIAKEATGKNYNVLTDDLTVGHYKPINSQRFINDCHEYVFHLTKSGDVKLDRLAVGVPYQDKSNVTRWNRDAQDVKCRGNTWFIPYQTIQSRKNDRPHPASFPPELVGMCMDLHGIENISQVLDPFFGIGSTAMAALDRNLTCLGFEIDKEYLTAAKKRIIEHLSAKNSAQPPK